jgi:hypothetical protein
MPVQIHAGNPHSGREEELTAEDPSRPVRKGQPVKFILIGEETIRLDMILRIQEWRMDETLHGNSVRKSSDRLGWIEVHFVAGEVMKFVGTAAEALRRALEEEYGVRDVTPASKSGESRTRRDPRPAPGKSPGPAPSVTGDSGRTRMRAFSRGTGCSRSP